MIRRFPGNSKLKVALGACELPESAYSDVVLIRPRNLNFDILTNGNPQSGTWGWILKLTGAGKTIEGGWAGSLQSLTMAEAIALETWSLMAVTKAAGTGKATLYYYRFDTKAWVSGAASTEGFTLPKEKAQEKNINFGNNSSANGADLAIAGRWNVALSKAQLEALVNVKSLQEWKTVTTAPVGLWMFGQPDVSVNVEDLTGNGAEEVEDIATEAIGEPPPIPYRPLKVKILREGIIKEAVRWIMRNGKLSEA